MVISWETLKSRYLDTTYASQLDSLVLNLARVQLLLESRTEESVARHLVRESQFFIEWFVPQLDLETDIALATELVELQRLFSKWKLGWADLWSSEAQRQEVANLARHWCDRLSTIRN